MKLSSRLAAGEQIITAWSGLPSPHLAGAIARAGYDAVTLDMQHGAHTVASVGDGVAAIVQAGKPAVVRVPVGRNDMASRAADFGAEAVIAPMINSIDDARAFAAAVKYPPMGERSWGPAQAVQLHRPASLTDYLHAANGAVLTFAMIETRAAVAALGGILDLAGIDAVFVGPSDFSISWTNGAAVDPELDEMMEAIADVAGKARAAGKHAGIFVTNPSLMPRYRDMGFSFFALGTESMILSAGASALFDAAR